MARIVVLGGGIGGLSAAYELRAALGRDHEVTLVTEGTHFLRKMRTGKVEPVYEKYVLKALGILRLKPGKMTGESK